MTDSAPTRRFSPASIAIVLGALALIAYFLFTREPEPEALPAAATAAPAVPQPAARPAQPGDPGVRDLGDGVLVDAQGHRVLNSAGLPGTEPLPPAKPIPIKADPNTVVGFTTDANGVSRPLKAGEIKGAANTPGTYAAVDMWAEGGPAVVAPTQGRRLSEAEVKRLRAEEAARERATRGTN